MQHPIPWHLRASSISSKYTRPLVGGSSEPTRATGNVSRCGSIHDMACGSWTAEIGTTDISYLSLSTTPLQTTENRANRICGGLSYRPAWMKLMAHLRCV
ncbi:hypothetical protein V8C35DRAFT_306448 [Trichoderma chlorosporum]